MRLFITLLATSSIAFAQDSDWAPELQEGLAGADRSADWQLVPTTSQIEPSEATVVVETERDLHTAYVGDVTLKRGTYICHPEQPGVALVGIDPDEIVGITGSSTGSAVPGVEPDEIDYTGAAAPGVEPDEIDCSAEATIPGVEPDEIDFTQLATLYPAYVVVELVTERDGTQSLDPFDSVIAFEWTGEGLMPEMPVCAHCAPTLGVAD
jgi:hypothetical protein